MMKFNAKETLEWERDNLINEVRTTAQNNLNMRHELDRDKSNLVKLVLAAKKLRIKIEDERDTIERIIYEMKTILNSYCSHLDFLELEADNECELDCKLFQEGEIDNYRDFLENFLEHRKDYHLYKVKARRLSKDLRFLNNIISNILPSKMSPTLDNVFINKHPI